MYVVLLLHQTPDTKTLRSCRVPGSLVIFPVLIGFRKIQQLLGQRTSGKIIVVVGQIFEPVLLLTVHAGRISVPEQHGMRTLYPHRRQIQYDAKVEKHLARRPNNDKKNSAASTHEVPRPADLINVPNRSHQKDCCPTGTISGGRGVGQVLTGSCLGKTGIVQATRHLRNVLQVAIE